MKNLVLSVLLVFSLSGCSWNCGTCVTVCPTPVTPSTYVMDRFKDMRDDVEMTKFWMDEYKLHRQLNICNTK